MRNLALLVAIVVLLGRSADGQGKTDPTLDKLAKALADAFNEKDAAKVAAFYAEDAVLMPASRPMVKGRANIEAEHKRLLERGATNLQIRPMESMVAGNHAFEAGTVSVTIMSRGAAVTERGKYVLVYKRVGGEWRIAYDCFNDDQPSQPAQK